MAMAWSIALLEKIHASNMKAGRGFDFIYMNNASDGQKPNTAIPAANLAKLKTLQEYGLTLVFTK